MPSVRVDVEVDLAEMCDISDLKLVVGYAMLAPDKKICKAAGYLNDELDLGIELGDKNCPLPKCDQAYLKWREEKANA